MLGITNVGGGGKAYAYISVQSTNGSKVIARKGTKTISGKVSGTQVGLAIPENGIWIVTATLEGYTFGTQNVEITHEGQTEDVVFRSIFGIKRLLNTSSTEWERTDDAVGLEAVATNGATAGHSDYSSYLPWSGMVRETLSTSDVTVKIPKFYFKRYRDSSYEYIKVTNYPFNGFILHPAFQHNNTTQDYVYAGAYLASTGCASKSGVTTLANKTIGTQRSTAATKGEGFCLFDISTFAAVQMLYLVEFADNNGQKTIGRGVSHSSNSGLKNTGLANSVTNLTGVPKGTVGQVPMVYRGIENLWGNGWCFLDGVCCKEGHYYVSKDLSKYGSEDPADYQEVGTGNYSTNWNASFITSVILDSNNPAYMFPEAAGASDASATTYYADCAYTQVDTSKYASDIVRTVRTGEAYNNSAQRGGLFIFLATQPYTYTAKDVVSRLMYVPS